MSTASAAPQYRIVDPHVHVWVNDPSYPWANETAEPPTQNATPDMLLDLMKANGVDRTVLVQFIGYRWDNSYALHALKKHAPCFMGVARVNPTDDAAPDHLSELTAQGFHGVRISPAADASGDWIGHERMSRLWTRAQSLKVPMQIYAPITRMRDMVPLIEKCPDLDVVIDHMADCPIDQPEALEMLLALARYPRVFVKISHLWSISRQPYPWLDAQEFARRCYDVFGPRRLMWGTDWPVCKQWTTYENTVRVVRDDMPFLNAEDKSWIMSRTVQRIWPFSE